LKENDISITFKPSKSNGGIWSIGFLVGTVLILIVPMILLASLKEPWFFVFMGGMIGLLFILFGITTYGYYSMKYIVTNDTLILKWSIFQRKIPLNKIRSISSILNPNLQGIRAFGVGIPGHLVGRFLLKFGGHFTPTTLYATNLENLVIIQTDGNKTYGITPDIRDEFIATLKSSNPSLRETELDSTLPVQSSDANIKKSRAWISTLFSVCLALVVGTFIYTIIIYPSLNDVIPLHWGVGGVPDRFGNKNGLLIMVSIFSGLEILISALVYLWMRKSDIGKIRMGILIMVFPLIISLVFSVLTVIIVQATVNYF
jgi:hypothetical protein